MFRILIAFFAIFFFGFQQAFSHDTWLEPKENGLIVAYGHGDKRDAYDPEKVKEAKAFDCKGEAFPVEIGRQKEAALLSSKEKPTTVTVLFDGGYGVKTTDGWKKITKREAAGKFTIVEALKSRKYAKALLTPCEAFSKPVGLVFEIVPEKDPFAIKPGEQLPITVLLDGKPVEGAVIRAGEAGHSESKDTLKSDKDGKASVLIEKPGPQLIFASHKAPLKDDPDADILSLGASLTFEAK